MATDKTGDAVTDKSVRKTPKPKIIKKLAPIVIKFSATISAIKINTRNTTVGLALPATASKQVSRLMESKAPDTYLEVTVVVKRKEKKVKDGKEKRDGYRGNRRKKRYPYTS